jgi:hypothetical protein
MARARNAITKIGVEARVLALSERRGVAQYVYRLLAELLNISDTQEYHVIVDQEINSLNLINHPTFIVRSVPACAGYRFNTWLQFRLPTHILRARYDLVFYPYNVLPLFHPTKSIVAIHDVKIQNSRHSFLGRQYSDGGQYLPGSLRSAERLIFVSEFTRREAEDVGLLDERYFLYYEDAEWTVRASRRGWLNAVVLDASARHKVSRSTGSLPGPLASFYFPRNRYLLLRTHGPLRTHSAPRLFYALSAYGEYRLRQRSREAGPCWKRTGAYCGTGGEPMRRVAIGAFSLSPTTSCLA